MEEITLNLPFLIAGLIILLGFLGTIFFQKTRIPDVLLLITMGVIIGPLAGWIDVKQLDKITPYFARLALIIILFEGGLHLSFDSIIKNLGGSLGLTIMGFVFSVAGIALMGVHIMGMSWMNAILLGCILGGTSSAIIIPIITKMNVSEQTRSIIGIESVLTDILVVIGTIFLVEVSLMGQVKPSQVLNAFAGSFSIAIVIGIIAGLLWMRVLSKMTIGALSYMTTIAVVLMLFGMVEMSKGSGAVAAFIFGLVLRNGTRFLRVFDETKSFQLNGKIEEFHGEITFFIRTYFFVYLGLLIPFSLFSRYDLLKNGLLIAGGLILTRYIAVWLLCALYKSMRPDRFTYFMMLPRGLAAAVVASLPAASKIAGTEDFVNYTILVILLSTIFMVFGTFISERKAVK